MRESGQTKCCELLVDRLCPTAIGGRAGWTGMQNLTDTQCIANGLLNGIACVGVGHDGAQALLGKATNADCPVRSKQ